MKKINCIAIDDEPIALLVIKQFCERKGGLELVTFSEPLIGLQEIPGESRNWSFWTLK